LETDVPWVETNTRRIVARLASEGWTNVGGGKHDKFVREGRPDVIIVVPRHKEQSTGVAREIARLAGWI